MKRVSVLFADSEQDSLALSEVWQMAQNLWSNHEVKPISRDVKVKLNAERAKAGVVGLLS